MDEMGMMLNNIKEGGVSLIGKEQPFTHDHFRKSFIRRNKNPIINEKAHTLRALQSTLKVSSKAIGECIHLHTIYILTKCIDNNTIQIQLNEHFPIRNNCVTGG